MLTSAFQRFAGTRKFILFGSIILGATALITFYPATKIGFLGDDWWEVANVGRMSLSQYLRFYFDPGVQTIWYRPLHGVLLLIEYPFFGSNAEGYRIVQTLLHWVNSLLLFGIVLQVSRHWRWAFVAALFYVALYPGDTAVFGIVVHDPLAMVFYLATVLFWLLYLKSERRSYLLLAIGSFILALLSKETSAALIVTMILADRIFVAQAASPRDLVRRYSIFGLILLTYLVIEYRVQTQGHFTREAGYIIGTNVVENTMHYLGQLAVPWNLDQPAAMVWLAIALLLLLGVFFRKPRPNLKLGALFFLGVQVVLAIAPVLGFATTFFESRYLYAASTVPAIVIAWLFDTVRSRLPARRMSIAAVAVGVALLMVLHSSSTAESATQLVESNREARVPFRDIVQQHPTFPPDTYLYFINPPYLLKHAAPSMFFFRYGSDVSIGSEESEWWGIAPENQEPHLRDHLNSFVYYYDDSGRRHEVAVDRSASSMSSLQPPVDFDVPIRLEGYELASTTLERGNALVLLLVWRAKEPITKDYTVFTHLLDNNKNLIAGEDTQPQNGAAPTSTWRKDELVVDAHIFPITSGIPVGNNYSLEVGLYLSSSERLGIVDATGRVVTDTFVIESFSVVE